MLAAIEENIAYAGFDGIAYALCISMILGLLTGVATGLSYKNRKKS